jgi:hypothetical protein
LVRSCDASLASQFGPLSKTLFLGGGGVIVCLPFSVSSMSAAAVYCSKTVFRIHAIDTGLACLGGGSSAACPASSSARSFPGSLLWPCTQSIEAVFPWAFSRWICRMALVARDWTGPVLLCVVISIPPCFPFLSLLFFFILLTVGNVGSDKIDDEVGRVARYEDWCNLVEDSELEGDEVVSQSRNNAARGTIIVRPPLRAA